jgi:two-component system, NtrC family, sensor kinase
MAAQRVGGTLGAMRLLLAAVIVLPVALFAAAAWLNYRWTFDEAWVQLWRSADAVREHALKVFETNELVLDRVAEQVGDLDWNEIAGSEKIFRYTERLAKEVPHIATIGFIAPDSRISATNLNFPMPEVFAQAHDYRVVHRDNEDDLFISDLHAGAYSGAPQFLVTRHKPHSAHPADAGMIYVSLRPDYFAQYYDEAFGGQGYAISIVRDDGAVLARYPELPNSAVLSPESGLRRTIGANPERGSYTTTSEVDGKERLFTYRKLGAFPVYVTIGLDRAAVVSGWWRQMSGHLVYGVPVTLALIAITLVALRRTARERAALLQATEEAQRREQAEASLRQAQKMEAVGQLTGGVAHDFNNLLTAIMGSLELILCSEEDAETRRKYALSAMRAAERGARLTQQLLAFSRRQILRPELVNVNRLLGEFETLMRHAVGESIDFSLELHGDIDPCRVDPAQFQSAILNLVVNARDATSAGGCIAIETRNGRLEPSPALAEAELAPGRYVVISVRDTGTGMTSEVRAQAFDPFFTTKDVGKGSGLGLSQVYGFAKQSGGHVAVESELGRGTTVRLFLPYAAMPAETRVGIAAPATTPTRTATVLIVEDDETVLGAVNLSLKALGYRTLTAADAREALGVLRRDEPIDLLFTDIVMPGAMNGVELAREARKLRQDIKVLLTSGYAATNAADYRSYGFAVLDKPYRQAELAQSIASVLAARVITAPPACRGGRRRRRSAPRRLRPRRCRARRRRGETRCAAPRRRRDPIARRRRSGRS